MVSSARKVAAAIVAAAGRGDRMGVGVPKQYLHLAGVPVVVRAIRAVASAPSVGLVVVAVPPGDVERFEKDIVRGYSLSSACRCMVVEGGHDRQESVFSALSALESVLVSGELEGEADDYPIVVIHDGARPLASPRLVESVVQAAVRHGAATCGLQPTDTVKEVQEGTVVRTLDRARLTLVQTPQAFRRELIIDAHVSARRTGLRATDDAALVEAAGVRVTLVPGEPMNIKITSPDDMVIAEATLGLRRRQAPRIKVGQGFDIHRTAPGRRLVLGGVEIPFHLGLVGHSDADVVAHAMCDAMLGAAGLGDIGRHFPDTDPRYEGADSMELLAQAAQMCRAHGFTAVNCDVTVIAQAPKVAPYAQRMREGLAAAIGCTEDCVNIKAKTTELLGAIGRLESMACSAVVLMAWQERNGGGPISGDQDIQHPDEA